ncbi:MAG: hypothetical protein WCB18_03805 [Thermoplasmata archaeon]
MKLLDTFPAFEAYWASVRTLPIAVQIARWESDYMAPWPELLQKQKDDYRQAGQSWQRIARARIFPRIPARLGRLRRLHDNLVRELPGAWKRTREVLEVDFDVQFVIYIGLGCGAGWATQLGGVPAVLFGLENAAEATAGERGGGPGAVSHEVAHLVHDEWRRRARLPGIEDARGPYWQLYEEGFATECERVIDGPSRFRLRTGRPDWLGWCTQHRAALARRFLKDVRARRSVRPFFGSWFSIGGHTECGYYLGAELIRHLKETLSLREIARLSSPEVRESARRALTSFAKTSG